MVTHLGIGLTLLAATLLAACDCDSGRPDLFADELHARCDDLPCDWDLTRGQARLVPFLHPAERALELSDQAELTRALPEVLLPGNADGDVTVELLATCDQATELVVEVTASAGSTGPGEPPLLFIYRARLEAGAPNPDDLPLPPQILPLVLVDLSEGQSRPAATTQLIAVAMTLRVEGPGRCTLDNLHLTNPDSNSCFG
jgi:hypothetical protein